jgi:hypothetical protein
MMFSWIKCHIWRLLTFAFSEVTGVSSLLWTPINLHRLLYKQGKYSFLLSLPLSSLSISFALSPSCICILSSLYHFVSVSLELPLGPWDRWEELIGEEFEWGREDLSEWKMSATDARGGVGSGRGSEMSPLNNLTSRWLYHLQYSPPCTLATTIRPYSSAKNC